MDVKKLKKILFAMTDKKDDCSVRISINGVFLFSVGEIKFFPTDKENEVMDIQAVYDCDENSGAEKTGKHGD